MKQSHDFLQFVKKEVSVEIDEPIDELLFLFKKLKYFKDDTIFLPFMNPEYGEGRYDGRFDNSEFFRDEIKEKLRQYLLQKNKEGLERQRKAQAILNKQKFDQMIAEQTRLDNELKKSIDMFNMDLDAGSMSFSKGGFSLRQD